MKGKVHAALRPTSSLSEGPGEAGGVQSERPRERLLAKDGDKGI